MRTTLAATHPPDAVPGDAATGWLRRLCIFVVVLASAEFIVATTGVQIRKLPPSTDFATYYLAGAQALEGRSPYDRAAIAARGHALGFAHDQFPFLYPPPFALAMQPLARLPYPRARQVWMLLCTLELFAALAATWFLVRKHAAALGLEEKRYTWVLYAAFVPAALNSTSVHNDIRAGSVGVLLYLMMALVALATLHPVRDAPEARGWAWHRPWVFVAGAALALATLAKLTPVFLVPWFGWRRSARVAVLALVLLGLSMLPALHHWGVGLVPDYVHHVVVPSLRDEVAPPMNQSLDAFLSRLFISNDATVAPFEAPGLKRVLALLLGLGIAALTLRSVLHRERAAALLPVELGLVVLAILLLMKLTWVHTLAAMLFVWPVLMLAIVRAAERGATWTRRAGVVACCGCFLSSAHVPILWRSLRQGPAVALTGVHLAGTLLLWIAALWVLERSRDVVGLPSDDAGASKGRRTATTSRGATAGVRGRGSLRGAVHRIAGTIACLALGLLIGCAGARSGPGATARSADPDAAVIQLLVNAREDSRIDSLGATLQHHVLHRNEFLVPWARLPRTRPGPVTHDGIDFACGVNLGAFDIPPFEEAFGETYTIGERRFYQARAARLTFAEWTRFDGFVARGTAIPTLEGLLFRQPSIVLEPTD